MNVSPSTSTDGYSLSPDPHLPPPSTEEPPWEWGALFDFSIDDSSVLPWEPDPTPPPPHPLPPQPPSLLANPGSEKVRKRDPRLTCENFLSGRVPCSCPEMDEKEDEEEAGAAAAGKKRPRRAEAEAGARCQVPGCEADIRELKGYHRRHRVCLRCANASAVMLGGQAMRYCQQCGKFHVLSDFDEGKRSCRRKLEKHNNRRRRKLVDVRNVAENEPHGIFQVDDTTCNNEVLLDFSNGVASTTENQSLSGQPKNAEDLIECEDGHGSAFSSVPHVQNIRSNSVASFVTSCETLTDEGKDYSKPSVPDLSTSFGNNKRAYSSVCPTGRMSFKLYDWNPAEFPRRLRHQIFQWLASMPIEMEGYIRPGCTILTLFIAMPRVMWMKLSRDAFVYLSALVNAPGSLLSGRSMMRIYLDDMMFEVLKDGTSLVKAKMEGRVPRLHYVHPTCFEAGKPMEFVVCGNNLFQPKFRPLVSFAGNYLVHESCLIPGNKARSVNVIDSESTDSSGHEMFKIYIPSTDSKLFGPAFIEVENVSGLSNFIPVLIGDTQLCSELQLVEQRFSKILDSNNIPNSCQSFVLKQTSTKELLSDVAWLLNGPQLDHYDIVFTSLQIQRLNCLLGFLIQNNCIIALQRIMQSYGNVIEASWLFESSSKINDADIMLFQKYVTQARELIKQKLCASGTSVSQVATCSRMFFITQNDVEHGVLYGVENTNRGINGRMEYGQMSLETSVSQQNDIYVPLVKKEILMDVDNYEYLKGLGWPQKACSQILSSSIRRSHVAVLSVTAIAVCFGLCVALSHPHEVKIFAVSVRRCLFGTSRL